MSSRGKTPPQGQMRLLPPAESQQAEREYIEHRQAVVGMLHAAFGKLVEPEELYQEAWTEALELRARGQSIDNLRGLLVTIAWRRARDRARNRKPELHEPTSPAFTYQLDPGPSPDEQLEVRLEAAAIRRAIDALEPRQAAALKLRFDLHLDAKEIQRRLGVSPKRLEKIVTEAYRRVQAHVLPDQTGESESTRRARSLLLACELGLASPEQQADARHLVATDPVSRGMLRQMRATLHQLGVAIPVPVVAVDGRVRRLDVARERLIDVVTPLKERLDGLFSRASAHGDVLEQAGAGAAGLGAGGAVKVVMACLAVAAGGATVCFKTGVLGLPTTSVHHAKRSASRHLRHQPKPKVIVAARPTITPLHKRTVSVKPAVHRAKQRAPSPTGSSSPSPAPAGSTEFGPGSIGSSSASQQPAAVPATGGGEFTP